MNDIVKVGQSSYTQTNGSRPFIDFLPAVVPYVSCITAPSFFYCLLPLSAQTRLLPYKTQHNSLIPLCSKTPANSCLSSLSILHPAHGPSSPLQSSFGLQLSPRPLLSRSCMSSMRSKPKSVLAPHLGSPAGALPPSDSYVLHTSLTYKALGTLSSRSSPPDTDPFSFSFASPHPGPKPLMLHGSGRNLNLHGSFLDPFLFAICKWPSQRKGTWEEGSKPQMGNSDLLLPDSSVPICLERMTLWGGATLIRPGLQRWASRGVRLEERWQLPPTRPAPTLLGVLTMMML